MDSNWLHENIEYLDYVLVYEKEENAIYSDQEMTDIIGDVRDYNNKIVSVIKKIEENGVKKILIEYKSVIAGWIVFENSIPLFNKLDEKIEVEYEKFYSPSINKMINKNGDYNLYFQRYQVFSRFYTYHENELLEAIFRKGTFVAFAPSKVIDRVQYVDIKDKVNKSEFELYATSKMDEKLSHHEFNIDDEVNIVEIFPNLKRAKIKQDMIVGWVKFEDLEHMKSHEEKMILPTFQQIQQQHIEYIYINEQKKVKLVLKKLLNENIALEKKINRQRELNQRIVKRLENLRNSKLGKLQLLIWERRSKRGKK